MVWGSFHVVIPAAFHMGLGIRVALRHLLPFLTSSLDCTSLLSLNAPRNCVQTEHPLSQKSVFSIHANMFSLKVIVALNIICSSLAVGLVEPMPKAVDAAPVEAENAAVPRAIE